jgi:hypothetical protein
VAAEQSNGASFSHSGDIRLHLIASFRHTMVFESIQAGVPDPMFDLKNSADNDQSPLKVDLGVGIYRNENGVYQELASVKEVGLQEKIREVLGG